MLWNNKRFHTLDYELKKHFGMKIFKLSLNGGFTCPNRDGLINTKGCLFCSEKGSGDFAAPDFIPIPQQLVQQKKLLEKKWSSGKYIAYFQSYTNTYAPIKILKKLFYEALSSDDIVGLAIATRPDCLNEEVIDLLKEINKKTYLWIELGLQTINEDTAVLIRREYHLSTYENAVKKLQALSFKIVTHVIFGLPNETKEDMLETIKYISENNSWGIKIHLLHILKNTDLHNYYLDNPFHILSQEEYINLVVDSLELLPPEMVVHRVTGDGPHKDLIAPIWSKNKRLVLNGIDKELIRRNSFQGLKY
jgi:radical SAM protein (TIGR01212 family)